MPIAFPPAKQYTILNDASKLFRVPGIQVNPNLARPGVAFNASLLNPGFPHPITTRPNLRNLGKMYTAVTGNAIVNPVIRNMTDNRVYRRDTSSLRNFLSGVTRDATEATLGSCQVMIFSTADKSFIGETTSDINGDWSMWVTLGWPFFRVVYKAGSPDVAGTSRNDIVPIIA